MQELALFLRKSEERLRNFFSKVQRIWLFAAICTILTFVFYLPEYYDLAQSEWLFDFIDRQIDSPLSVIEMDPERHRAKRAFRLFIPMIGKLISLSSKELYFLQQLLLVPFYFLIYRVFLRYSNSYLAASSVTLAFVFTFFSKTFIFITPYFDAPFLFLTVIVLYTKISWLRIACFSSIGFVDERGILSSSLLPIILYSVHRSGNDLNFKTLNLFFRNRFLMEWFASICLIMVLRVLLVFHYGFVLPSDGVGLTVFRQNFKWMALAISNTYQGFSILFITCIALVFYRYENMKAEIMFLILFILGFTIAACSVFDLTRSLIYIFPAILYAVFLISKGIPNYMGVLAIISCLVCFFLPDLFIIGDEKGDRILWLSWFFPKVLKFF